MRRALSASSLTWLTCTGLLVAVGVAVWLSPPVAAPSVAAMPPGFDLQGHRGARGLAPENTLPGFAVALAIGVTTLEMDVGMTGDGVLVVHHDRRLDPQRTRGPDGAWIGEPVPTILSLDRAALAAYDVGRARPDGTVAKRFPDQRGIDGVPIPTLAEVVARAEAISAHSIRYNIEIKTAPDAPDETASPQAMAEALVALLTTTGVGERATVQSFDWRSLRRVQEIAPAIPTVYLTAEQSWLDNQERGRPGASPWTAGFDVDAFDGSVPRTIKAAGGAVWSPYYRDLREADLQEAHRQGLRVVPWTVNDPTEMQSLIALGVDGLISDYPDRLRAVLAERDMALPPAFPSAEGGGG